MRLALGSFVALLAALPAQTQGTAILQGAGSTSVVAAQPIRPLGVDVPAVPKAVLETITHPPLPKLPVGFSNVPQPTTPPASVVSAGPQAVGDMTLYKNTAVALGGAIPTEPSATSNGSNVLCTWNTQAAVSTDSGNSYGVRNLNSVWPAADAGLCCDQRVLYVPEHDMTIWLMQYGYSSTTQKNTYGLAVFQGSTRLQNLTGWVYLITPANLGFAPGRWMDFPDISFSRDNLYFAANVFDNLGTQFDGVVVRLTLAPMATGGSIGIRAWQTRRDLSSLGASYRLTQGAHHASTKMWWAAQTSSAQLSIWEVDDAATTPTRVDRAIATFTGGGGSAPGPDGRQWVGANDGRITGGYVNHEEMGFLWTCRQNPPTRLMPYVRVSRYRVSDRTLLAEHDIADATFCFAYPGVSVNTIGQVGLVLAYGSSTAHVSAASCVIDHVYQGWGGLSLLSSANGTNGAPADRWGDYLTVEPWTQNPLSFVGTQMRQSGGTSQANTESRVVMFQRNVYGPGFNAAVVMARAEDGTALNVPITAPPDSFALGSGTTPMARSYLPAFAYTLQAAATHTHTNGVRYCFKQWLRTGVADSTSRSIIASSSAHWVATYVRLRDRDVRAVHPTSSVTFSNFPADCNGWTAGTTPQVLTFADGTAVSVTAPDSVGNASFVRWSVPGVGELSNRVLSLAMTQDRVATAEYFPRGTGSWAPTGGGCRGSHGSAPFMSYGGGTPTVGGQHSHQVYSATPSTLAWNVIGGSNTTFAGLPLPFDCAPFGAAGCRIYCSHDVILGSGTDASGSASVTLTYPRDRSLAGQTYYTQFLVYDPAANQLDLIVSNYLRVTLGL